MRDVELVRSEGRRAYRLARWAAGRHAKERAAYLVGIATALVWVQDDTAEPPTRWRVLYSAEPSAK